MAGPRIVAHLDERTVVAQAQDGQGQPWLFVGGLDRLPGEQWGCACRFCAGVAEQIPYESVFHALIGSVTHRRTSAAAVHPFDQAP